MKKYILLYFTLLIALILFTPTQSKANIQISDFTMFFNQKSPTEFMDARRGGSFRSSRPKATQRRSNQSRQSNQAVKSNPQRTPSFGGSRMTQTQARQKYGTPRRTSNVTGQNQAGTPVNYNVNHYGGFSSSLMTGYLMGNMAWWMMMPAMLYSRPAYVENEDGSLDVYPPTFNFQRLFFILLIVFGVIYFIRGGRRRPVERRPENYSSFG